MLARAVRLDADHRAEAGRPISADRLRHELGVGSDLARRLVRELREHAGPNGHAGDEAGQLQLAGGGRHEHCVPYVDPDQAGRLARDTAHLLRDLDGHGPSPRLEVVQ